MRDVQATISRLGQFQIDSINVVTRAHYMPLFSRLGAYDPGLLERAAHRPPRRLFEYWGHAASLIDVTLQPLLRFRMQAGFRRRLGGRGTGARREPRPGRVRPGRGGGARAAQRPELEVEEERDRSHWGWNWSGGQDLLEWLFYCGEVTSAYRNSQFERVYDLPERVLPAASWPQPTPDPGESVTSAWSAGRPRRSGVASEFCLRDYFRTRPAMTRDGDRHAGRRPAS